MRLERAAVQRTRTFANMHSVEEGQGKRAEVEKITMIILVVGNTGEQGPKRKRGKKLR